MLHDPERLKEAPAPMSMAGNEPYVPSRVGGDLRAARERLGWSLPDVANTLRIRQPYLEAIEEGRLSELPGNAYAVGFVRTYATALGLDPAEISRRFRTEAQEVNRKTELAFPAPVPERGVPVGAAIMLGLLLIVGSYAAWYRYSGDASSPSETVSAVPERLAPLAEPTRPVSNPSPQVASILPPGGTAAIPSPAYAPAPVFAAPVTPPVPSTAIPSTLGPSTLGPSTLVPSALAPAAETSRVMLRMKSDSYIQVKERQGGVLLNRVMRAGESWPVPRGQTLLLTTGNAAGTEIVIDGVASVVQGAAGVVRRDIALDADALKPGAVFAAPRSPPRPAPAPTTPASTASGPAAQVPPAIPYNGVR